MKEMVYYEDEPPEPCDTCNASGEVEDTCYCAAREPFECCCGGWDDVDLDEWYRDE
jgi:hypothetical protein